MKLGTGHCSGRPTSGYRGAEFDFISVETKNDKGGEPTISYTLDTRRARSEVRGQRAQSALLRDSSPTASNDQNRDEQIGRTLFNLLIPVELEAYLAGSGEMQNRARSETAKIPWELLDTQTRVEPTSVGDSRQAAAQAAHRRDSASSVTDAERRGERVLVIGEPECPGDIRGCTARGAKPLVVSDCLTGARRAGYRAGHAHSSATIRHSRVRTRGRSSTRCSRSRGASCTSPVTGCPARMASPGGVVLSNGHVSRARRDPQHAHGPRAGVRELLPSRQRRRRSAAEHQIRPREFASGVAGALIAIGVRCVVAAGWAVDDDAAGVFAEEFYGSLLRGNRFIDAVGEARAAARRAEART